MNFSTRTTRVIGMLLMIHFIFACAVKFASLHGEEVWWLSHISLLMAALGFLFQSKLLRASALINIFALHGMWIIDGAIGQLTGTYPIGVASYMADANLWIWLATSHHIYLLPLLLVVCMRHQQLVPKALLLSVIVYAILTIISRLTLPVESNVNYAFRVELARSTPLIIWSYSLSAVPYLIGLNLFVAGGIFFPTTMLLRRLAGEAASHHPRRVAWS